MSLPTISRYQPKEPQAIWPVTFDFGRYGDTIDAMVWSVQVVAGADPDVASMLLGTADKLGATTTQLIRAGISGNIYLVRAQVTMGSAIYTHAGYLKVQNYS